MTLSDDDFTLFGLPRRFVQDVGDIDRRWKLLQRHAHPDRFAGDSAAAQRLALQWSARLNEARQRLRDPVQRAALLCALGGHPIDAHENTAMPGDFLQQQMQWREALDEAADEAALLALASEIDRSRAGRLERLAQSLDVDDNLAAAACEVRALMFIERLAHTLRQRQSAMAEASLAQGPMQPPAGPAGEGAVHASIVPR